ncbi:MAG: helix-turn-helix domain-containing protein [Fimbriimonadaceae bacterium]
MSASNFTDKLKGHQWGAVPRELWKTPLSRTHRDSIAFLLTFAGGEDWTCWPGQALIMKETGYGRMTIYRAILAAERYNILTVERRYGKGGKRKPNRYIFNPVSEWTLCTTQTVHGEETLCTTQMVHGESDAQVHNGIDLVHKQNEQTNPERTSSEGNPSDDRHTEAVGSPSEPDPFVMFSGEESENGEVDLEAPHDDETWWPDQKRRETKGRQAPLPESPVPIELDPFGMSLAGRGSVDGEVIHHASIIDELLEMFTAVHVGAS